jgi:hypothetical protein
MTHQPSWPGLVPAIHVLQQVQDVDTRDKRGHDELKVQFHIQSGRRMSALMHIQDPSGTSRQV